MRDIGGSRGIERAFMAKRLGTGQGLVLDIGPGPKAKTSLEALARGFDVVAVDLETVREGYPKMYSLKGDRKIEWGYVKKKLPHGEGFLLEIGPAPANPKPARIAASRGWTVSAVGIQPPQAEHQQFTFIQGDFNEVVINDRFDYILNISTVEHMGLVGRYGITVADVDADLKAMRKACQLLKNTGRMLLTIPVGVDNVMGWHHRVYGKDRLPLLLAGYKILEELYYNKHDNVDEFRPARKRDALRTVPTLDPSYYALGCFVLERA